MALSGNGRYLAVDTGSAVRHWDLASGSELFRDFADLVFTFAFSPDGDRLATVERNRGERVYRVRLRDLGGEGVEREWEHPERAEWVQWGPQALVVGGQDAWLYDPESGELRHRHPLEQGPFALSPDGRLIAISLPAYIIEIRSVATGASVARTSYGSDVSALAFGPDNRSLTTVSPVERNVRVWFFESDGAFATLSHAETPLTVRFASDGAHLYTGTEAGEVGWRLPGPGAQAVSRSPEATPAPTGLPGTDRIELPQVSGCGADSATFALHLERAGVEPRTIEVEGAPLSAALNAEGDRAAVLLATGSTRGGCARRLEIWNLETQSPAAARDFGPLLDQGAAALLQFIGDDNYLVVGVRGGVEIVEAAELTSLATLYHAGVARAAIQADGTLAATQGDDGLVRIWDVETLSEIARIESSPSTAALALSPDDRWLATLEPPDAVRLWAVAPDELIQQACRWLAEPCP
jgi:WD40 repeat protein